MKPRVFLAHRHGFAWFTSPHLSFIKLPKSRRARSQALSKVVWSDLQHLSSNGVAYLEDRTEDKGQALLTIKAKKHSQGAGEHLLGHEQVCLRRCGLEIGQL